MELEFELDRQAEELLKSRSHLKMCPKCNKPVHGTVCSNCGEEISGSREHYTDPDFEDYEKQVEEENERYFSNLKWEDTPDDG
jgi:predicted amidophosphoribosyltransferase